MIGVIVCGDCASIHTNLRTHLHLHTPKHRFTEFDTFRDGVLDKHEYMHLCAKLVTEAQQREGSTTFNEKHCR